MYKRLVEEIEDFKLKEIFRALRDEEEKHVTVMENLSQLLIQPKSWFEGANFKLTRRY
jgi:rubrerythrin